MTLVTGNALDPARFFKKGSPEAHGSSFDLTIGSIFDPDGKKVEGHFTIKPGHMVQVVSSEVFNLSDQVTGHVTYKTTLTKKGIWALTVGIVDPGWDGPITTTLLNFSKVDHTVAEGDSFLRVSLFEHDPVTKKRTAPSVDTYLKDVQKAAASMFPATFLDSDKIAEVAGGKVLDRIRKEALGWVALIAVLFTVLQLVVNFVRSDGPLTEAKQIDLNGVRTRVDTLQASQLKQTDLDGLRARIDTLQANQLKQTDLDGLRARIDILQASQLKLEQANSSAPASATPNPSVPPAPVPPSKN